MNVRPETVQRIERPVYHLSIQDLLLALAVPQRRKKAPRYAVAAQKLVSLDAAMSRLRGMVGFMPEWSALSAFMPEVLALDPLEQRSAIASTFAASLELAKFGEIVLRQDETFGTIYLRRADPDAVSATTGNSA